MRAGWKTITLNDACIQMNGIWKGTKEPLVPAKVLRTSNFSKDCRIKLDDLAIIDVEKKKLDARRLQRGDIIVEKSGGGPKQPVGRVILFDMDDDDYSFCNFTSALRIKDKEQLDFNYIHKYLTYLYFEGETEKYQSNLVGFRNLDFKGYVGIEVPYPSLPEQQRIVDILDQEFAKIDALKANAEKSLQAAKDLFQATLKKELEPKEGWGIKKAGDIFEMTDFVSNGSFASLRENVEYLDHPDYAVLVRLADYSNGFDSSKFVYVSKQSYDFLAKSKLFGGEIIMSNVGSVGKSFICPDLGCPMTIGPNVVLIRSKNNAFYQYYFQTEEFQKKLLGISSQATLLKFNKTNFKTLDAPVPPTREQDAIVSRLDVLNDKCKYLQKNYQKTLALCDDLKQSLLRKAFNGEL